MDWNILVLWGLLEEGDETGFEGESRAFRRGDRDRRYIFERLEKASVLVQWVGFRAFNAASEVRILDAECFLVWFGLVWFGFVGIIERGR